MTMKKKVEMRLKQLEWMIESCNTEMQQAKKNMEDALTRCDLDIATFMDGYADKFKAAFEKKRQLEEEKKMLNFILEGDEE